MFSRRLTVAALVTGLALAAGCNKAQTPPTDPAELQKLDRQLEKARKQEEGKFRPR
jgi:hypothetical protein